jgi:hypothetical protein
MSALVSTAIGLCLSAPAVTDAPASAETRPTAPLHRRNAVIGTAAFPIPDYGVGLSYMRALGRRYSVSAGLDYAAPRKGYGHLVGLSQTLGAQVWITRPLHGLLLGASGSLRFAKSAGGTELVCTREGSCPATRSGIYARLGVDVGWAF